MTTPNAMPNMLDLKNAMKKAQGMQANTTLVYGAPKVGKTGLLGTVAFIPTIKRIIFFDVENGSGTLLNPELGFTDEHLAKVSLIPLVDTKAQPNAIETLLKYFSSNADEVEICFAHGKIGCTKCGATSRKPAASIKPRMGIAKPSIPQVKVSEEDHGTMEVEVAPLTYKVPTIRMLTPNDCIIIDTLSQVGVSAGFAGDELQRREEAAGGKTNAYGKYMKQGELLTDLLSMLQATRNISILCAAHSYTLDDDDNSKPTRTVPAIGTQNYSRNVAKYFSNVVYMSIEAKSFKAGSSPLYKLNHVSGSRLGNDLENIKGRAPVMADILMVKEG